MIHHSKETEEESGPQPELVQIFGTEWAGYRSFLSAGTLIRTSVIISNLSDICGNLDGHYSDTDFSTKAATKDYFDYFH